VSTCVSCWLLIGAHLLAKLFAPNFTTCFPFVVYNYFTYSCTLAGGMTQWLGRWSLVVGLSLTSARSMVDG